MRRRRTTWPRLLGWLGWWVCGATNGCAAAVAAQTDASAPAKLPAETLLVKGAWSTASDSTTPVPEGGTLVDRRYINDYFGLRYPLPTNWTQQYQGPPPSDSGYYVLAQIAPSDPADAANRGTLLITAHDLFFSPVPAGNALELANDIA